MTEKPPSTQLDILRWNERSKDIRSCAREARQLAMLIVVSLATVAQLLWWQYESFGFDLLRFAGVLAITTIIGALLVYVPRQMGVSFWPVMQVICGLTICAFIYIPIENKAVVFALTFMAGMPAFIITQLAIYWISRPMASKRTGRSK